jgi:uncharacterized protein (TIGR00369 family)
LSAAARVSIDDAGAMLAANFAEWVQALDLSVVATAADSATLRMPFHPRLHRVGGIVSGQALMALADTAMVLACCTAVGEFRPMATVDVHTTFLRPATDTAILATATVLRLGRTMAFAEVRLVTEAAPHRLVATATGNYVVPAGA